MNAFKWQRAVIKVGSALVAPDGEQCSAQFLLPLARFISASREQGKEVILVSSGSVAAGRRSISVTHQPSLAEKQAMAAIGQTQMMANWARFFDCPCAQILLTAEDLADRTRYVNIQNTLRELLKQQALPIVNENDSVATAELKVGDNDNLGAYTALVAQADTLIMCSDIDGLFTADPRKDASAKLIPSVSKIDGKIHEPWEHLTVDFGEEHQGTIMTKLADRKGKLIEMTPDGKGRFRLDYSIPTRGLIGFRTEYLSATSGTGLMYHIFDKYDKRVESTLGQRNNGVLVSMVTGKALAYALYNLQERGKLMAKHADEVYEGMVIGINSRTDDLNVNPTKAKQLNNMRASGNDENIVLTPAINFSLEQALEFINDDELVEVTPSNIRIRKKLLKEVERKRASR